MNNTGKIAVVSDEEMALEQKYTEKILALNQIRFKCRVPLAFVDTYGCSQNVADSQNIRGMLDKMGYAHAKNTDEADLIILNTCAVREHAQLRVFGSIGALVHLKRRNPDLVIAVCGCMVAQTHVSEKIKKSYAHVDLVFAPHAIWRFPELLYKLLTDRRRVFDVSCMDERIAEGMPITRDDHIKASVSITYGCNNFCTYCIVPYVRGRERSRNSESILNDVRTLIADGYKEINLLGQNVNSYGAGLHENINFPALLRRIDAIDGDFTVRFMTSHPKDATRELIDTIACSRHISHQLHLPVQSGSDRILKLMNRHYDTSDYLALISYAKKTIPDLTLSSDIIVGFPDETDEDFEDTLKLIQQVRYSTLFSFIYSKRCATPAAAMENQIPDDIKQTRFERLLAVQSSIAYEIQTQYVGKILRVLIDGLSRHDGYNLTARTDGGRLVHLSCDKNLIGSYADVRIFDCSTGSLFGEII